VLPDVPGRFIAVDTTLQRLMLHNGAEKTRTFTISTSRFGIGNREHSNKTPQGIHRIVEKIGDGAPAGRIFRNRLDTGIDSIPDTQDDNLIVTRILRLEGLEEGINRGEGIDSYERYIYIHGTNRESAVGTPISHGCIVMKSADIIELFNAVEEGTIVVID
jgi:hypothetical protein